MRNSGNTQNHYLTISQTDIPRRERLEAIKSTFFLRRGEDSGTKQLDVEVLMARTISCERHLTNKGIVPEDYNIVYELAVQIHVEKGANGPFGIDEILTGANEFITRKQQAVRFVAEEKVKKIPCEYCNGTSLEKVEGKIQYNVVEGKKVAKRCVHCYEG